MRVIEVLTILLVLSLWIFGFWAYSVLPERVPIHFNASGKADSYGSKVIFLILPPAFTIAPLILLFVSRMRKRALEDPPYWLNLPSFFTNLKRLPEEKQRYFVDSYFDAIGFLALFMSFCFLLLEYGIYLGVLSEELPFWFDLVIFALVASVIPFLLYLRKLSKEFESAINVYKSSYRTGVR